MYFFQRPALFLMGMSFLTLPLVGLAAEPLTVSTNNDTLAVPRTELTPLMERYLLDDLKAQRTELEKMRTELLTQQEQLRVEFTEQITEKELQLADSALNYSMHTITFFFFVVTGAGALIALIGWNSIRDMKSNLRSITDREVNRLTKEYETRLTKVEKELRERGEEVIQNQKQIEKTQQSHLLWWQAEMEKDDRKRMSFYQQILEINPEATEAHVKKSWLHIVMRDFQQAVDEASMALKQTPNHSTALYNRACAYAQMDKITAALDDLEQAILLSEGLRAFVSKEKYLQPLHQQERFLHLLP